MQSFIWPHLTMHKLFWSMFHSREAAEMAKASLGYLQERLVVDSEISLFTGKEVWRLWLLYDKHKRIDPSKSGSIIA